MKLLEAGIAEAGITPEISLCLEISSVPGLGILEASPRTRGMECQGDLTFPWDVVSGILCRNLPL